METPIAGSNGMVGSAVTRHLMVRKILLVCGILAALLYVGSDILAAMLYEGYSYTSQTVSELRAIGAPTRPLLVPLLVIYTVLEIAFGLGVWGAAGRKRALRITGVLLLGLGVVDLVAPFFPMHLREAEETLTDTMHIILTAVTVLLILLAIGFGATADGEWFRRYSIGTILVLVLCGAWAFLDGPRIAANLPTPWVGVRERINIYGYMLWMMVLAIVLLRAQVERPQDGLGGRRESLARKEDIMTTIKAFIKRHPVLTYYALTFAISWGGFLLAGGPGILAGTSWLTDPLFPIAVLAMLAGPPVAGILLTVLVSGKEGLRELLSRLLRWRVGARWYAVALLTAPLLQAVVLLALSLLSPKFLPAIVTTDDKATLLLLGLVVGILGGLEELGWTGFAIPELRRRYGILTTGLIVGVLWGAWHFLLTFWGSGDSSGALSLSLLMPPLLFYVGVLPAYRVLMVWVYDRTESLLVAILMHTILSASTVVILMPVATGAALSTYYLVLTAVLWLVLAAVAVANRGPLSQQPLPREVA